MKLAPLSYTIETSFARLFMLFGLHLDIVLWVTAGTVAAEEGTIAAVQNVHLGI